MHMSELPVDTSGYYSRHHDAIANVTFTMEMLLEHHDTTIAAQASPDDIASISKGCTAEDVIANRQSYGIKVSYATARELAEAEHAMHQVLAARDIELLAQRINRDHRIVEVTDSDPLIRPEIYRPDHIPIYHSATHRQVAYKQPTMTTDIAITALRDKSGSTFATGYSTTFIEERQSRIVEFTKVGETFVSASDVSSLEGTDTVLDRISNIFVHDHEAAIIGAMSLLAGEFDDLDELDRTIEALREQHVTANNFMYMTDLVENLTGYALLGRMIRQSSAHREHPQDEDLRYIFGALIALL
jgi:hypothetical protein